MDYKELKQQIKKELGLRWYWIQFTLLFDFEHQYENWLDRQYLKHTTKVDYYADKIKKHYAKYE